MPLDQVSAPLENRPYMKSLTCLFVVSCACNAIALVAFAGPEPMAKEIAPTPPPSCDWRGFYIGVNAGGQFGAARIRTWPITIFLINHGDTANRAQSSVRKWVTTGNGAVSFLVRKSMPATWTSMAAGSSLAYRGIRSDIAAVIFTRPCAAEWEWR